MYVQKHMELEKGGKNTHYALFKRGTQVCISDQMFVTYYAP